MKQITILSGEQGGAIAKVTEILAAAGVNLESITGEHYGGQAIVIVTVDDYDRALEAIGQHSDLQAMGEDAILLRVEDEVGALAKIARRFTDAGINIRSIRFVERHSGGDGRGHALVAVSTERTDEALALVGDLLVS